MEKTMKRLLLSLTALTLLASFTGQAQANWITDGFKFVCELVRNNPKTSTFLALGTAVAALYAFATREVTRTQPLPVSIINAENPGQDIADLAINDTQRGQLLTVANGTVQVPVECSDITVTLSKDGRPVTALNFSINNKKRQALKTIN